jgi:glycosyltransferase involved in cell wall biosynthesis
MADTLPRISIVTPSYNQGAFIEDTVRSVLLQRYPNLEYIVMDGGSSDDTLERLEPYRPRLAHLQSAPDGGQSAAIAAGFARSTGDIMAYLNSDDILLPGALRFVAEFFQRNPGIDFIYGHRAVMDEEGRVIGHWILPRHSSHLMRRWDLIPQETCFWRRSLFERAGNVDPSYRFAMDYELFVRFMARGRMNRVDRFLAAFRVHTASKTSTQLTTVGEEEIRRVRSTYRLWSPAVVGYFFSAWVQFRSALYLRRNEAIAGLAPGAGHRVADAWAGLLTSQSTGNS